MKKIVTYLKNHKHITIPIVVVGVFFGVNLFLNVATAQTSTITYIGGSIFGGLLELVNLLVSAARNFVGFFLLGMMNLFVMIAAYNDFSTSPVISSGWALVRDISNMFIVVGLLVIAFMSAFSSKSEYNLTRGLGNFVLAAIAVNFSKMITLLAVDVSQVVMMTFVNSFKEIGTGNVMTGFGLENSNTMSQLEDAVGKFDAQAQALASNIFVIIAMVIVLAVIIALMAIFLVRVVALWVLVVISPLAFAAMAIPIKKFQGIKEKWVSELSNWLVLGPMLSFFIWLSFATMTRASAGFIINNTGQKGAEQLGRLGTAESLAGYVVSLALLLYGIKYSIESSGSVGQRFGSYLDTMKKPVKEIGAAAREGFAARFYDNDRTRWLTKKGRGEAWSRSLATVKGFSGGQAMAGAKQEEMEKQAEDRVKTLQTSGAFQNKEEFRKRFEEYKKRGDAMSLRAMMKEGAKKGWLEQSQLDEGLAATESTFGVLGKAKKGMARIARRAGVSEASVQAFTKMMDSAPIIGVGAKSASMSMAQFTQSIQKDSAKAGKGLVVPYALDAAGNEISINDKAQAMADSLRVWKTEEWKECVGRGDCLRGGFEGEKITAMIGQRNNIGKWEQEERDRQRNALEAMVQDPSVMDRLTADQKRDMLRLHELLSQEYEGDGRVVRDASGRPVRISGVPDLRSRMTAIGINPAVDGRNAGRLQVTDSAIDELTNATNRGIGQKTFAAAVEGVVRGGQILDNGMKRVGDFIKRKEIRDNDLSAFDSLPVRNALVAVSNEAAEIQEILDREELGNVLDRTTLTIDAGLVNQVEDFFTEVVDLLQERGEADRSVGIRSVESMNLPPVLTARLTARGVASGGSITNEDMVVVMQEYIREELDRLANAQLDVATAPTPETQARAQQQEAQIRQEVTTQIQQALLALNPAKQNLREAQAYKRADSRIDGAIGSVNRVLGDQNVTYDPVTGAPVYTYRGGIADERMAIAETNTAIGGLQDFLREAYRAGASEVAQQYIEDLNGIKRQLDSNPNAVRSIVAGSLRLMAQEVQREAESGRLFARQQPRPTTGP